MSFWDTIRKVFSKKKATDLLPDYTFEEIWEIDNVNNFLVAMSVYLGKKCAYGEEFDRLSDAEQVFYICNEVAMEVNNGGFSQYLYNSSGDHAHRAVDCMNTIGAKKIAKICEKAFSAFGKPIPQNWEDRQEFLDENETEKVSAKLEKCDDQFYDYPDDLDALCYQYIQTNRAQFS